MKVRRSNVLVAAVAIGCIPIAYPHVVHHIDPQLIGDWEDVSQPKLLSLREKDGFVSFYDSDAHEFGGALPILTWYTVGSTLALGRLDGSDLEGNSANFYYDVTGDRLTIRRGPGKGWTDIVGTYERIPLERLKAAYNDHSFPRVSARMMPRHPKITGSVSPN